MEKKIFIIATYGHKTMGGFSNPTNIPMVYLSRDTMSLLDDDSKAFGLLSFVEDKDYKIETEEDIEELQDDIRDYFIECDLDYVIASLDVKHKDKINQLYFEYAKIETIWDEPPKDGNLNFDQLHYVYLFKDKDGVVETNLYSVLPDKDSIVEDERIISTIIAEDVQNEKIAESILLEKDANKLQEKKNKDAEVGYKKLDEIAKKVFNQN